MRIINKINELRENLNPLRQNGESIGFVPTMGYLHQGHMALMHKARVDNGTVVASIFVNPLQFETKDGFSSYPSKFSMDCAMLEEARVDYLFAPAVEEMYPYPMQTFVEVSGLSEILEGERRPGHFRGVATVVAKLFAIVQPSCAYFGEKDYQQLLLIRHMVDDLALPIRIIGVPTVREADGLACSSRNVFLNKEERSAATVLSRALDRAERAVRDGFFHQKKLEALVRETLAEERLVVPDLVAIRDAESLDEVNSSSPPEALVVLIAAYVGRTRLIDQRVIRTHGFPEEGQA